MDIKKITRFITNKPSAPESSLERAKRKRELEKHLRGQGYSRSEALHIVSQRFNQHN